VVNEAIFEQDISRILSVSFANHHSTILLYSSITPPKVFDSPKQATLYQILDLEVVGFNPAQTLT